MKADILRYELLTIFGGVYVDCDFLCCKNIDSIINDKKFIEYNFKQCGIFRPPYFIQNKTKLFPLTHAVGQGCLRL